MSLVVTIYVPSGIVMAADSRMTVLRTEDREESGQKMRVQQQLVLSDSAYKIVELNAVAAGVAVYDSAIIANQPVESQVRRFEEEALSSGDDVKSVAEKFMKYFQSNHPSFGVGFHVAGYRQEGKSRVPYVLVGHTTREPEIRRVNADDKGAVQYGVVRAGDVLVANRLIDTNYLPLFAAMPLQEAIDYAVHLIRSTIDTLRFEPRFPTVGGPIDVLVVQPQGMHWVQRKELRGEA
jgi:20S proteasome alpha/beta subunit